MQENVCKMYLILKLKQECKRAYPSVTVDAFITFSFMQLSQLGQDAKASFRSAFLTSFGFLEIRQGYGAVVILDLFK